MAYSFGIGDRFDDDRFKNNGNSNGEPPLALLNPTFRGSNARMTSQAPILNEARASLQRRFTTNTVLTVPEMSPIGQQRRHAADQQSELLFLQSHNLLERKQAEYELLKKRTRAFQNQMELLNAQRKSDEDELHRLAQELGSHQGAPGYQSESTTPPEFHDAGFPSAFSKPTRFSTSSVMSPPGLPDRLSRAPSQTTSPPSERALAYQALTSQPPTHSVPGSQRNSDEEEDDYEEQVLDFNHRSAASLNRNSMPVTRRDRDNRNGVADPTTVLGHVNTSSFLFGDDEPTVSEHVSKSFLQMNMNDDKFPTLIRRNGDGKTRLSALSTDLDPVLPHSAQPQSSGWTSFKSVSSPKHMSMNAMDQYSPITEETSTYGLIQHGSSGQQTPTKTAPSNRHSMGSTVGSSSAPKRPDVNATSPPSTESVRAPPKLLSSWSTNDIPTIKSTQTLNGSIASMKVTPQSTAEQRLHNHNASLGRIPPNALNRHSRELSAGDAKQDQQLQSLQSVLQSNSTPPVQTQSTSNPVDSITTSAVTSPTMSSFSSQPFYGGYGMQFANSMANLHISNQNQWNQQVSMYQMGYNPYNQGQSFGAGGLADSQARVIQQRRVQNGEDGSRFTNIQLEELKGEIYGLCKDQHGCRFLQKKLEERKPEHIELIFQETKDHMVELMTDPFGNYLCQKLLEYTEDDQRTALINSAAPQMVKIALNQHGTRALQKMIEFVSTSEQIETVTCALQGQVVPLIQDLNGNHVIQKCLNRLTPQDAQFIFDAVGTHCVTVGTHRHGCCVIQRCIDHSSGDQKAQLVASITSEAFPLVQDPFGNYVVQYILDLGEPAFAQPLCRKFIGRIAQLSKQKFSSNVMEKCIRIADVETKHLMIEELLNPIDLDKMLRDSFANYVIQTAMDYANGDDKPRLYEAARPTMPAIRHTPYGRRIASKIQDYDTRMGAGSSGQTTPVKSPSSSINSGSHFSTPSHRHTTSQASSAIQSPSPTYSHMSVSSFGGHGYGVPLNNGPQSHRLSNPPVPHMNHFGGQTPVQQPFFAYGQASQHGMNGMNNY